MNRIGTQPSAVSIAGKRDVLAGKIQETYGLARNEAERQIKDWESSLRADDFGDRPRS